MVSWRSQRRTSEEPRQCQVRALTPNGHISVAYTDWGPADAHRTVICVHGLTRNGRDFDWLARELASRDCHVVAPDLPGRGRSEWLKRSTHYANATYLAAIAAVIAQIDVDAIDWVGTSLGAYLGMEMAVIPGNPIRRLVLNDFGARVPADALRRIGQMSGQDPRFGTLDEVEEHLRRQLAPFGSLTDSQWRHMAEHGAMELPDGRLRLNHDPAITQPFTWPFVTDFAFWHLWDEIDIPTLIIRGVESDFLTYQTMRAMALRGRASARGQVATSEMRGCGHAPALMSREQIDVVIGFLLNSPAAMGKTS
jgi:pimeloyl-ACP methyl ester carboxylesterase